MSKPYCGIHKLPKNRVRGTSQQCIKSGQARYYGIMSVEDAINEILAEKRKVKNEKLKLKRQEANKAVKEANNAKQEVKKVEQEAKQPAAKKTKANNKIKLKRATTSTKKINPINLSNNEILKAISTQKRGRKK